MPSVIEVLEPRAYLSAAALQAPVQVAVGQDPVDIAAADFNGDGLPDLVTVNTNPVASISILLNTGNGTFAPAQTISAGIRPTSVTVGDFNGDGAPDIAVTDAARGVVEIFLNQGNGTFAAPVDYSYGTAPGRAASPEAQVVAGDFTDNGITDLAIADDTDGKIAMLLGAGNGTFPTLVTTPMANVTRMVAADFNDDGLTDLAVIASGSDQVDTLLSTGNGTFRPPIVTALPGQPTSLINGDFAGAGQQDLAVAVTESSTNAIDIAFGSGTGHFTSTQTLTSSTAIGTLSAGDFIPAAAGQSTGFAAIDSDGAVTLFQNSGTGTFQPTQPLTPIPALNAATTAATVMAVTADFDGTGAPDLALIATPTRPPNTGEVTLYLSLSPAIAPGLLATLSGALPASAISGHKTRLTQTLTLTNNTNGFISGQTAINLYLSTTRTVAGAIPVLSFTRSLQFAPGASRSFVLFLNSIPTVPAGSYFLVASAAVARGPSVSTSSFKSVTLGLPFVNLAALSLNAPKSARIGSRISVRLAIQNLGNARLSRAVPITLGISTNPSGAGAIALVSYFPHLTLAPGQKRTGTLTVKLGTALTPGTYYLLSTVDPNNTLNQPNTSKNTAISGAIVLKLK